MIVNNSLILLTFTYICINDDDETTLMPNTDLSAVLSMYPSLGRTSEEKSLDLDFA